MKVTEITFELDTIKVKSNLKDNTYTITPIDPKQTQPVISVADLDLISETVKKLSKLNLTKAL